MIDVFTYLLSRLAHLRRYARKPLRHIDKQILHRRHIGLFTADTRNGAAFAARSFLTLETKHLVLHLVFVFFSVSLEQAHGASAGNIVAVLNNCDSTAYPTFFKS